MTLFFDAIRIVAIGVMAFVVCGWIYSLVRALLGSGSRWKAAVRNARKAVELHEVEVVARKRRIIGTTPVWDAVPVADTVPVHDAVPPGLVMALDRLTALHREGALTAAEFAREKERLLGSG